MIYNHDFMLGVFAGLILGDGYLGKGKTKHYFEIKSINEDFIQLITNVINNSYYKFNYTVSTIPPHYSCGCNHKECWVLNIASDPFFNELYDNSFSDSGRIVTNKLLSYLNPIGIAMWYMSDGYICLVGKESGTIKNRRIDICTDRYKLEDVNKIKEYFINNYSIDFSVITRGTTYRLRVRQVDYEKFIDLISLYIVESMSKKLYLGYPKKPLWMSNNGWEFQEFVKNKLHP